MKNLKQTVLRQMLCLPVFLFMLTGMLSAKVLEVQVEKRTPVLQGKTFGGAGAYELVTGKIIFGVNPKNPANTMITDLEFAPVNREGWVESIANFAVLQPCDPEKASRVMLVEVSNRGGIFSMRYFNGATHRGLDPDDPECFGDALLLRQGITVVWVGWEFDVPDKPGLFRLKVPVARKADGGSVTGLVRSDWTVDKTVQVLGLGHHAQIPYPVADTGDKRNVLTVRNGREAPRRVVPRNVWSFAGLEDGKPVPDRTHIYMKKGFTAGKIYELVYVAEDPPVVGLGLTAIRDIVSYAKYDPGALFPAKYGIAAGVSQTGRFLRYFLYQGLNRDEDGRKAFDGMMIITAGAGRGSFNHRFAQPSRDAHRYSAFFYPTDVFPFTGRSQTDALTGITDGLLAHLDEPFRPLTFYVNTGYEYWGRAASLIHTSVDGKKDIEPLSNERIYHICSGQHYPGRFPPQTFHDTAGIRLYRGNPLNFYPAYRALLVKLTEWVAEGKEPPASSYPKLKNGTLMRMEEMIYPVRGLQKPSGTEVAYRMDYGPRWKDGIVDNQPPLRGKAFPVFVPATDSFGNEVAGIRNVEVEVPLATYLPWNLRWGYPAATGEMTDFSGTFIPFATRENPSGNPEFMVQDLYPNEKNYLNRVDISLEKLIRKGFLLEEDIPAVKERAGILWQWVHESQKGSTKGQK
ncbi:MAG: hypothetical protein GXO83_05860 [Chlorobi bacterium]|nr:hypothetical protein [Chlorobiota bacterium]